MGDNNKDGSDHKTTLPKENSKTKKNRSKLLANMIMKAKEKIRNNSSNTANNQTATDGSVTCLYDIRDKSATSQSSKSKICEDSDSHLEGNTQSQPNLQTLDEIPSTSKDSSRFKLTKVHAVPSATPILRSSLQKDDTKDDLKNIGKALGAHGLFDCLGHLNKCASMAFVSAAVKEMLDFNQRLQHSEAHLLDILKKYLKDNRLEKELTDMVTRHITLQIRAERQAQSLANDMWLQQAQFYKNQEKVFNETIKEILNQNKKLQEENEILTRKNEKMHVRMVLAHEDSGCSHDQCNLHIVEHLGKNNEKLRFRNNQLTQKLRGLEDALAESKEQCADLEKHLQNCFCEIQNQKRIIQNTKLDQELETAILNHKIESNDRMFQDAIRHGEGVIEEITAIKQKLQSVFSVINWKDLQRSGNVLLDIFMTCKLYIKEMASYIAQMQNNASTLEKSNQSNKNECSKLREALNLATTEVKNSMKQAEVYNAYAQEKESYITKINDLEEELRKYKQIVQTKTNSALEERAKMMKMLEGLELLKIKISEKDEQLQKVECVNEGLKQQIAVLNNAMQVSGAGDVARELVTTQEKLLTLQSMYHKTVTEKDSLIQMAGIYSSKLEILVNNETGLKNKLTELENEVKALKDVKAKMKDEITTQKATLTALQGERKRHLEEKTFLKTVYDKVKSDAVKAEELENTVHVMSKETSRLTAIAEYNKQLGDRLQTEIDQRDAVISELQENIKKLGEMQKASVKEKAALCEELTEVCSFKEILSNKLENEMSKNIKISESKKELETNVAKEMESLRNLQTIERNAVHKLLCDFNDVLDQRNKLANQNKQLQDQITKLEDQKKRLEGDVKILKHTSGEIEEKIATLNSKLRKEHEKTAQVTSEKEKLMSEKNLLQTNSNRLQESVTYLKQNIKNMQNTIDNSKATEVELQVELRKKNEDLNKATSLLEEAKNESCNLASKLDSTRLKHDQLLGEYLSFKNDIIQITNLSQNKLQNAENELTKCVEKIANLEKDYQEKVVENQKLEALIKEKEREYTYLMHEKDNLQRSVDTSHRDKKLLSSKLSKLKAEHEKLKTQSLAVQEKIDEKEQLYKSSFEELFAINEEQVNDLKKQINYFRNELKQLKDKFKEECQANTQLEISHKELAAKLLKAVHMLIDEKLARQSAEAKISQMTQEMIRKETEQVGSEQKLTVYSEKMSENHNRIQELQQKLLALEEKSKETESRYQEKLEEYDKLMIKFTNLEGVYKEELHKSTLHPPAFENEDRILSLKCEIDESHAYVMKLQGDIFKSQQDKTALEFENTEIKLQLDDLEKRVQIEEELKNAFHRANERTQATIMGMKEDGELSDSICDKLLDVVKCET
ncbi:hypothetical protein Trydic_g14597 [Trypoxylus dichotomus]